MRVEKLKSLHFYPQYSYFAFNDKWSVVVHFSNQKDGGSLLFYVCWWKDGQCYAYKTERRDKIAIAPDGKSAGVESMDWFRVRYRQFRSMPFYRNIEAPLLVEDENGFVVRHETVMEFPELKPQIEPSQKEKKAELGGSVVYFVKTENSPLIKIGTSAQLGKRLSGMQVGNPNHLTVLAVEQGGRAKEKELHKKFRRLRLRGEWHRPEPELLDYIKSIEETIP